MCRYLVSFFPIFTAILQDLLTGGSYVVSYLVLFTFSAVVLSDLIIIIIIIGVIMLELQALCRKWCGISLLNTG